MAENYAIYLRKSRADIEAEELGAGETLARHYKILTALADKKNIFIAKIYKELVSGESIQDRPEMQKLLEDVYQKKYKGVLVVEVERLARGDTKDQGIVTEAFKYSDTLIITPVKTYDPNNEFDEEYFEFGLFMSRREYKTINRRLQQGRIESIKEGNYIVSKPPFGYDILWLNKKERTLSINEEQAEIVRIIFNMFANEGAGTDKIASILTEMGVKTHYGSPYWNKESIKWILKNPVYIGKIRWNTTKTEKSYENGRIVKRKKDNRGNELIIDGKHPPIIDEEVFNRAQERFSKIPSVHKNSELRNVCARLLVCKHCGRTMIYQNPMTKQGPAPRYSHPWAGACKQQGCKYDIVINLVIEGLKNYIKDFEIKMTDEGLKIEKEQRKKRIAALENNLKKLEKKENKLYDFLEDGIYTKDEFLKRKEKLNEQISDLKDTLKGEKNKKDINYSEKAVKFHQVLDSLLDEEIPVKTKNAFLTEIIERIEYEKVDGEVRLDIFLRE